MAEIGVIIYILVDRFLNSSNKCILPVLLHGAAFVSGGVSWVRHVLREVCCAGLWAAQRTGPQPCWESFRVQGEWRKPSGSKQHNRSVSAKGAFKWITAYSKGIAGKEGSPFFWPSWKHCALRNLSNHIFPPSGLSIHQPTHPTTHSSTYPSLHLSIHPQIWSFIYLLIHPSTHLSIHPPTHPSTHLPAHLSTHPPKHLFTHPLTHPSSIYPPTWTLIHPSSCLLTHLSIYSPIHASILVSMHASTQLSFLFLHSLQKHWLGSTTCQTPYSVGATLDKGHMLHPQGVHSGGCLHHSHKGLLASLVWPSNQVATLGPPPRLGWEGVWGYGKQTSWGRKHLGVSSDTRKGFVLGPGLHSLRLPGEWQALTVDRGMGVPVGVIQSPLCPSSPFWAHELHHGGQHGLETRWLFQECSDNARPLGPWWL